MDHRGRKGLDVVKAVANARPDLRFVLCGSGDPSPWVGGNVEYMPAAIGRERAAVLSAASVVMMPTRNVEPFGGSGVEAQAQLEAMQADGRVGSARVYSPTEANRKRLAEDFRRRHGMQITDVGSAEEAVAGADIILAAVKSMQPVLFGRWLRPGMHVNSVGTARRDQREIDQETFERSARIVVDTREGVFGEAGDAFVAKDVVANKEVRELSELVVGAAAGRSDAAEITLFKSVGTGIQDIALAAMIYERARERDVGSKLESFPFLKRN